MLQKKNAPPEAGNPGSVRDRILDTAAELFYTEGVRAVGVDLVVEHSGVAKTSLYRHFSTKDDLVAAFLERDDRAYWKSWGEITAKFKDDPGAELQAHVRWIAQYIARPSFRGCPFINVLTEFPEAGHPARVVALGHKTELRRRVLGLTKAMGVAKPAPMADQLVLLIDGAYVNGQMGKRGPSQSLVAGALALVAMNAPGSRHPG
ncbi:transcriptional regulator, TetR family [Polaromonas sp. YR568]|uniref:TetR/AcrR family transcriptional regulator n=1 Tax=Polaromonas sp. YR568 TaxID=1855301 RepID=UPI0008E2EB8A|nr:TetR/AcrR family transcriptional regulator [Polaromonas sp. YR568]SFU49517.1 transcriptional regulator, TetR family [Polaromonas sp. YR568]